MSLSVNSISGGNSYAYPAVTDSKESSNDTKKSKKSKQVISEKVGKYYCTYVVDESNNKHLISKIPIDKMEKQKLSKNLTGDDATQYCLSALSGKIHMSIDHKVKKQGANETDLLQLMNVLKGGTF
ncbi:MULTISPECIES: hypothetical protein [Clostridium]|uniref:Uncharacterized protein n=3 Tax=Clostridium TaxID=1485 RepID=D8GM47_CLOLD|nr:MULTISPECIES: hypothetical protein [Clostridium]ADK15621.1 hypothetical protein CLJU_c25630 [Clostridium ljungdahlii DSM 13528]ALU35038.1 Hypothetical protein CLAU_0609 [Clostridium autoethanogenum DSM 10061]OAA86504.1 hypothetical protein WX45_03909 [Clostridium ljungdahlii DSM 13528]OVY49463.1 hypothetical protein WX72_03813 [Clostridium autoethanogenum]RMD03129.1 hypothetical protein D9O40_03900 [Clostridium autoethanogenum]